MSDLVVVAVSADLMDRSKLTSGLPGVQVVRPDVDFDAVAGAALVIVDLALVARRTDLVAAAVATGARVVAYGSHVDEAALDAASEAGAQTMPRSVFFRRLAAGTLTA